MFEISNLKNNMLRNICLKKILSLINNIMETPFKIFFSISIVILSIVIIHKIMNSETDKFITKLLHENTKLRLIYNKERTEKNTKNTIIINDPIMFDKIAIKGELGLAESYMDGNWDTEDLEKVLMELDEKQDILISKLYNINFLFLIMKEYLIDLFKNKNDKESVKNNVSHHYDIGNDLYEKMLDKNMQYTCAYFHKEKLSLDEAQVAKMELIAKKLNLKEGMELLDIGCGFGGLANYLANKYKVKVTGVTLSKEQIKYNENNFKNDNVTLRYLDYRDLTGSFDRVYSIGMFEHVGKKNYKEYYDKCYDLLKDDGIMMIHTIGSTYPSISNKSYFINKYIFPEAELPSLSDISKEFVFNKWHLEDFQNFGLSYSKTLKNWHNNIGDWSGLDNYDQRFRRMWDFYLLGCSAAFSNKSIYLWQFIYTKKTNNKFDGYYIRS